MNDDAVRVPACPVIDMTTSCSGASPGFVKHTADVEAAHANVAQLDVPSRAVGVALHVPKLRPVTAMLQPLLGTALLAMAKLTTGAVSQVGTAWLLPTTP